MKSRQKLLSLASVIALAAAVPVLAVTCYQKDTGFSVNDQTSDPGTCAVNYDEFGEIVEETPCIGEGCSELSWLGPSCMVDEAELSCSFCDVVTDTIDATLKTGNCEFTVSEEGGSCGCTVSPNGTAVRISGPALNVGTDCETCPERTGGS